MKNTDLIVFQTQSWTQESDEGENYRYEYKYETLVSSIKVAHSLNYSEKFIKDDGHNILANMYNKPGG